MSLSAVVVDMRWGVRDEATDDHQTVSLCSREIDNCQRMSLGPNFVALLGDKYGFRPLGSKIKSSEFRALRQSLIQLEISTDFLDVWYKEDLNAIPAEYILQPISSILKNFTNRNEPELQSIDQRIWQAIQDRLHELLLVGSNELVKQGRMAREEQQMKYSISVTEREIIEGCLNVKDAKNHCLVYIRSILGLKEQMEDCLAKLSPISSQQLTATSASTSEGQDPNQLPARDRRDSQTRRASLKIGDDVISLTTSGAQTASERRVERERRLIGRYIDMCCKGNIWKPDEEAQAALAELKEVKLENKLRHYGRNMSKFKVFWHEQDGISLKCDEHKRYLNELAEHFYAHLTRMIRKAAKNEQTSKSGLINELLQHSHYARHVSKSFHGRDRELDMIRDYILEPSEVSSKPMFIYGVSGSGKTSLLARVATLAKSWIIRAKMDEANRLDEVKWNQRPCVLMRFCGTTPSSSSMVDVLTSVCRQLQFNFYQFGPLNGALDSRRDFVDQSSRVTCDAQLAYQSIPEDFVQLVFAFRQLLDNCRHRHHEQRVFVIILDSIERLCSPAQSSVEVKYSWLTSIARLPPNVRLIVSCGSEQNTGASEFRSYAYLKRHFMQSYLIQNKSPSRVQRAWILHVKPMGIRLALEVVRVWLQEVNRTLSQQQWSLVEKCFSHCSRPIFVKLAFGEVSNWRSYSMQSDTKSITFGSSLLKDKDRMLSASSNDKYISMLLESVSLDSDEGDEMKWQTLNMEQEWLNYLDYKQRKQQIVSSADEFGHEKSGSETKPEEPGSVVIKIDAMMTATGSARSSSNATSASASICHLSNTIDDAISQLFARIELQHGFILTKHSLSYITAARNGICENELEDILSLDDIVLDDVFQYHLPPVRRIPPLLWTRIRMDLPDYLSERDADGIVINWHHSQFREVTKARYLKDPQQRLYVHSIMADYFLGRWADKPKPFRCTRQQIQMAAEQLDLAVQQSIRESQTVSGSGSGAVGGTSSGQPRTSLTGSFGRLTGQRSGSIRSGSSFALRNRLRGSDSNDQRLQWMQAKAYRRVPHQPLYYLLSNQDADSKVDLTAGSNINSDQRSEGIDLFVADTTKRRYNMRKLTELPYHLIKAERYLDLAQVVLFNYQWLFAALQALGLQSLLLDFEDSINGLERSIIDLRDKDGHKYTDTTTNERISLELKTMELVGLGGDLLLDTETLQSIVDQLRKLYNTIRLSCSTLHSDTQMLAPQLLGRLSSIVGQTNKLSTNKWLAQLLDQCDKQGSSDCSLLPIGSYLQSPDGMQVSSLEGHSFGITSMSLAADQRHLLAVSNRFIMWDISTGQISRDVDPKIKGSIMCHLEMGRNNEFAVAYTSSNLILVFDILTQQVTKFSNFATIEPDESPRQSEMIRGLHLIDKIGASKFVVWTWSDWSVFRIVNDELNNQIVSMKIRVSIELVYRVELRQLIGFDISRIVSIDCVKMPTTNDESRELCLVQLENSRNSLRLLTVRASHRELTSKRWNFEVIESGEWSIATMAISSDLEQVIFSDKHGAIHVSYREGESWSSPIEIYVSDPLLADSEDFIPSSIEIDDNCISNSDLDLFFLSNNDSDRIKLSKFEKSIDNLGRNDEIEVKSVLEPYEPNRVKTKHDASFRLVRLYYGNKIAVLELGRKHEAYVRILNLPKDVQNIRIEANKCRLKSASLGSEYLVIAAGKQLLFYSISEERLLRCIEDAHDGRVVQILPIRVMESSSSTSLNLMNGAHESDQIEVQKWSVATASMDKTVKIWTLSNIDKDERRIDRLDGEIECICMSPQPPLAACLARGQMGLFNWATLKLVHPKLGHRGSSEYNERCGIDSRIMKCQFSSSGQMLSIATTGSINVYFLDLPAQHKFNQEKISLISLRMILKFEIPRTGFIRELRFILQDSRLLVMVEHPRGESFKTPSGDSVQSDTDESRAESLDDLKKCATLLTDAQMRVFRAICLSIKDDPLVYAKVLSCPTVANSIRRNNPNYMATEGEQELKAPVLSQHETLSADDSRIASRCQETCVPVITIDGQHFVAIEPAQLKPSDPNRSLDLLMNIYSTRDGLLMRSIDLSRIDCSSQMAGIGDRVQQLGLSIAESKPRPGQTTERAVASISTDQFSSMKATLYRERQSVVALVNRESNYSYLIDINTRQLMACSNLWNGKTSTDGRLGLTRFHGSALGPSQAPGGGKRASLSQTGQDSQAKSVGSFGMGKSGLELLDMHRMTPIRPLLSDRDLNKLSGPKILASRSGTNVNCGFTRPNDAYVYYHDSRLARLLLIRLRDSKLLANYRLATSVKCIEVSPDGLALVLGQVDGFLCSLAVVDPENSDTAARLSRYPSRTRNQKND